MRVIMNVLAIAICQGVIRLDFSKNLHGKLPFLCPKTIKSHNFAPFRRFDGTLLSYVRQSTRLRKNPSRTPKIHQNSDFLGSFVQCNALCHCEEQSDVAISRKETGD